MLQVFLRHTMNFSTDFFLTCIQAQIADLVQVVVRVSEISQIKTNKPVVFLSFLIELISFLHLK